MDYKTNNNTRSENLVRKVNLKDWYPINTLPKRHQDEIISRSSVIEYKTGESIFRRNDQDEKDFYLLEGNVVLVDAKDQVIQTITSNDEKKLILIDHHHPRVYTAKTTQNCRVFATRRTFFDTLNTSADGQLAVAEVDELDMEGTGNWMLHMLSSNVYSHLPQQNLQQLFPHVETMKVLSGTEVVRQGELGKYFYLIQSGHCVMSQQRSSSKKKQLCTLEAGDTFGERSLIMNDVSDVSIESRSNCILIRVEKHGFDKYIKDFLMQTVTNSEANSLIEKGASWIDVRNPKEHHQLGIRDSLNITIDNLHTAVRRLNPSQTFIFYSDQPTFALASAFLFVINGFKVYTLRSSVSNYLESNAHLRVSARQIKQPGEPNSPMGDLDLDSTPEDVLIGQQPPAEQPFKTAPAQILQDFELRSQQLEQQIRSEIHALYHVKQKELETEINQLFKKFHLTTSKLLKQKLAALDQGQDQEKQVPAHSLED